MSSSVSFFIINRHFSQTQACSMRPCAPSAMEGGALPEGFREVPHPGIVQFGNANACVENVRTGERLVLEEDECKAQLGFAGDDVQRAFLMTSHRHAWVNDLMEWSVWRAPNGQECFFSAQEGLVWAEDWDKRGRSSGFCSSGRSSGLPQNPDDVACTISERDWFHAEQHCEEIATYVQEKSRTVERDLCCLDLFSASRAIERSFLLADDAAVALDIQLSPLFDITCKVGFFKILDVVLRLQCFALLFAGPPCSLFVWLSSSVHRRCAKNLLGNTANYKVRLSNLIVANLAPLLRLASERSVWWILEQPRASWLLKQAAIVGLSSCCETLSVQTWMGSYGHMMPKPTTLLGTLPTLPMLIRDPPGRSSGPGRSGPSSSSAGCSGQHDREYCFYTKHGKQVTGGRDLHLSASHTEAFAMQTHAAWERAVENMRRRSSDSATAKRCRVV